MHRHVNGSLRSLMKGVQAKEIEVDEDNIEELVRIFRIVLPMVH